MGGKDDDRGNTAAKWIEAQQAELSRLHDKIDKDLRSCTDDTSSSLKSPFERFKNFVDSNISTLSEGFKNFPSNISELKARMQLEREARMNEEQDIWLAWTGSMDSPDHIQMQIERSTHDERELSREAVYQLLLQAFKRNQDVPADKIMNLYSDNEWNFGGLDKFANPMLSFGGACYYKPETVENLPSTARWGWPAPSPQWLSVDWFKRSPYSPIRLETYPGLEEEGCKWRAAFEDLLSAALDKPMVSEEKVGIRSLYGKPQSTYYGPGLEWMLSLQCRGILPPQLPSLYKPVSVFDGFDEVKRPRMATFMHDIHQIITSKSATMYPLVKRDLEALVDEVSIKSGPETEAEPVRRAWGTAPWRVPDTEEDLYDEMPPLTKPKFDPWEISHYYEIIKGLRKAILAHDLEEAARIFSEYSTRYEQVGDLLEDVLYGIDNENTSKNEFLALAALRRSDVPATEQKKAEDQLGTTYSDAKERYEEVRAFLDDEDEEEPEARLATNDDFYRHNSSQLSTRPDVLAQLTTTQTTRLPDGSVTTKVVLKQRFADGREEERETVHTSHEPPPGSAAKKAQDGEGSSLGTEQVVSDYETQLRLLEQQNWKRVEMARQERDRVEQNRKFDEQPKKEKKKAGWFWS